MRHLNYLIGWLLVYIIGCPGLLQAQADKDVKLPAVALAITLERGAVEIGDSIPLVVQLSNGAAIPVSNLRLSLNGPAFVSLRSMDVAPGDSIRLGELVPFTATNRNGLRLVVAKNALVGDFNLLFTLSYTWQQKGVVYHNQAVIEKPLHIGLLGTDKIIGIPLAFAQFIVPGLFFLSLLALVKVPFAKALDTQEKLVFSVLISVLCLFLVNYIGSTSGWSFARQLYEGNTISLEKLFYLALVGVVLGGMFWGGYETRQYFKRIQLARLAFREDDKPVELVWKALKLNPRYEGHPWMFTCKDERVYYCAHYFETDLHYILVGVYKISKGDLQPKQEEQLRQFGDGKQFYQTSRNLLKLLDYSKEAGITLHERNLVKQQKNDELAEAGMFYAIGKDELRLKQHVVMDHMKLIVLD
ncbi:hypothetical protein [Paraflavitalea pollutisoli]|uniref:COG1470 family protein n=1 Tax=Paraflavitalea pollutisoli TaxID=3034143 RepID=UPI0023EDAC17|nr:hypothetical protein [Paraflavitalea sp. H1-2-19X]